MKRLKVYLDTSIWNFVFADDAPEKRDITKIFFGHITNYEIYVSNVVIEEIQRAPEQKRMLLEHLLHHYRPIVLEKNQEVERLANVYVAIGIIPKKNYDDALHVGYSVYYGMDVLLSWNYKHLANVYKKKKISLIDGEEGYYHPLELITPLEVLPDEK